MDTNERTGPVQVVCIQLGYPDGESKADRRARVLGLVDEAAGADLVVLPELWPSGYFAFDRYATEAEPLDGETVTALRNAAHRHRIHLMGGSFVERHADGLANCAVLLGPDGTVLHTYRKIHLFGYESQEATLLTPGRDAGVATTPLGTIGTTTCYDLRFPELYRMLVDAGAQLVIIPAAWPAARLEHWRLLLRARAVEDQMVVVACNGAGSQHGVTLAGHSMVIDPWGAVVAEAGDDPQLLTAEVDMGRVADVRAEFPVLQHRRIDIGDLVARPSGGGRASRTPS
jgi:predicted amidohydrolase